MANNGLGAVISEAFAQIGALKRLTVEAAKAQLSKDGARLGGGIALIVGAIVAVAGIVPLLVLAFVWGLVALGVWIWAAHLIAAAAGLVLAAGLAVAGRSMLKKAGASISRAAGMIKDSVGALTGAADPTAATAAATAATAPFGPAQTGRGQPPKAANQPAGV